MLEELAYDDTALGGLSLRRRRDPRVPGVDVYEVKLGDAFLMSSLVSAGETALARIGLEGLGDGPLDVVVGGLGLGYTAAAALEDPRVAEVVVVEYLAAVVQWHRRSLVPLADTLTGDARCRIVHGDFFALAAGREGFDHACPGRRFHAVLLDVDHSPRHWLGESSAGFYGERGLRALQRSLHAGGVFAMWSDEGPDADFLASLRDAFPRAEAREVIFPNPYTGATSRCTVYRAVCDTAR